ncbi:MAG: hypothetical protein NC390_02935 [Fusobacterium sp.]|nr:hypothetical protein [Fusobacterium sp.]
MNEDLFQYEVITGDELNANALGNLHIICDVLSEFFDVPACAFVKNGNLFAAALGKETNDAYLKAFDCDPLSTFSASVGFSSTVDAETAKHLQSYAIPMVVAPDFEETAVEILSESETILVKLTTPLKSYKTFEQKTVITTPFGEICKMSKNKVELNKDTFKIATKTKPTTEQIEDAIFAWKISKYLAPISVAVAKDFKTISIFQAQSNAQCALEYALNFACDSSKNAVLHLSDDLLTESIIHAAAQARIGLIIYSGGDADFRELKLNNLADKYEIAILTTGLRQHGN